MWELEYFLAGKNSLLLTLPRINFHWANTYAKCGQFCECSHVYD